MSDLTPEMQTIKDRMKDVWSSGDFGIIAKIIEHEGTAFINRLDIAPGLKVLDVACGNGNLALPAARNRANVSGIDIVADLIRQAKERAGDENLNIKFEVGDAEALPYNDNEFDYVVTMFGAMFAPRPEVAVNELLRVCKPCGVIAMANWTPEGYIGKFFKLGASYAPPPPGIPAPALWGDEETVKQRFGNRVSDLKLNKKILQQNIPMSPGETVEHFITYFGPTNVLYKMLDEENRTKFKRDFLKLLADNNIASDGTTIVDAEYLEVAAVKK